jgi:hypothetical protein
VLVAPGDLDEAALAGAVERGWGIGVTSMGYLAAGWGSHHWKVAGADGTAWFVTVDELEKKRQSAGESLDDGFARLRAALRSAIALRNAGREFVVAPVPAGWRATAADGTGAGRREEGGSPSGHDLPAGGEPVIRFGGRFAVAVYPFAEGRSYEWGEWTADGRAAVLGMVAEVHTAPERARREALADDFRVPFREQMTAAGDGWEPAERGPYTRAAARLLREHAAALRGLLDRYDALVAVARARPGRNVLTHGEPHPGNAMLTASGWRLIDWDTALIAPPERDLWHLDAGDGSALAGYAAMTGVAPLPELIELYRLGWDIRDIAGDTARFFGPHDGDANDEQSWRLLTSLVEEACGPGAS